MHFNKMIIAGLLVCCSLTAVACGKNRENTSVVTSEYNAANVKDYEEDGVKYREETRLCRYGTGCSLLHKWKAE